MDQCNRIAKYHL